MQFVFIFYIVIKIHARDTHINAHHPHRTYGQRSQSNTQREHRVIAFVCDVRAFVLYNMEKHTVILLTITMRSKLSFSMMFLVHFSFVQMNYMYDANANNNTIQIFSLPVNSRQFYLFIFIFDLRGE